MGIKDSFRHAFGIDEKEEGLNDEEKRVIELIARGIIERRLSAPAVMFLESVKPLNFIGSQAMVFLRPIIAAIFPTKTYDTIEKILEKRKGIDYLLERIENIEGGDNAKRD